MASRIGVSFLPKINKLFTLKELFNARVHLGHKEGTLNAHMKPYLFGSRLGVTIIDLNQTVQRLREALNFAAHISYRDGIILFITSCRQSGYLVEKTAKECGQFSHCRDFSPYTFTNSTVCFGAITRLPDLCIFLKTHNNLFEEHIAVRDAAKMCIPSIAIVDSNSDPTLVTYPVPGNDDTPDAIELYCRLFKQAIIIGKEAQLMDREKLLQQKQQEKLIQSQSNTAQ